MIRVMHGDCREILAGMPADSVDACVTDPPYGLEFMGVAWDTFSNGPKGRARPRNEWGDFGSREHARHASDAARIARNKNRSLEEFCYTWATEIYRVLKPGGHMLCFGGTRTQHRMVCAIEDAGFEIRDTLMWIYGSGFPKSHNVSVAIDKMHGIEPRSKAFNMKGRGDRADELDANGRTFLPEYEAATPEAARWAGWHTALKPSHEPIVLARKPLDGTVAACVLKHGTGAINVDATRIQTGDDLNGGAYSGGAKRADDASSYFTGTTAGTYHQAAGRWPANILHDGSPEVMDAFAAFGDKSSSRANGNPNDPIHGSNGSGTSYEWGEVGRASIDHRDTGTAARFFKECKWTDQELSEFTSASDAAQTFNLESEQSASALSDAVAQSMQPLELQSTSYQGQSMTVSAPELRTICASVTALTQNIAAKYSQEWPHGKLSLSNDPVFCVAQQKQTGTMRITVSLWKSGGYVEAATFNITETNVEAGVKDSQSRFHYTAKANAADRADSRHPTVKPIDLMRWLVRLITPPNGTILDPFAGSGTTGEAAMLEGFNAILIEQDATHVADIQHRIDRWSGADLSLFKGAAE